MSRTAKRKDDARAPHVERPEKTRKHSQASPAGAGEAVGVHPARVRFIHGSLNPFPLGSQSVVYWMSRDQRVQDNWALLYAQQLAQEHCKKLVVVFNLVPKFLEAGLRQYDFMLRGLQEVESDLA